MLFLSKCLALLVAVSSLSLLQSCEPAQGAPLAPVAFSTETKGFAISEEDADGTVQSIYNVPTFEAPEGMELWRVDFYFDTAHDGGMELTFMRYVENETGSAGSYSWTCSAGMVELLKMDGSTVIWSRSQTNAFDMMAASVTAFDGTLDYTGASGDSMIGLDGYEYDQAIAPFYTSTPSIVALFAGDGSDRELKVRRTLSESFGSTPSGMTTLETKKIGLYGEIVGHYREAQKH